MFKSTVNFAVSGTLIILVVGFLISQNLFNEDIKNIATDSRDRTISLNVKANARGNATFDKLDFSIVSLDNVTKQLKDIRQFLNASNLALYNQEHFFKPWVQNMTRITSELQLQHEEIIKALIGNKTEIKNH